MQSKIEGSCKNTEISISFWQNTWHSSGHHYEKYLTSLKSNCFLWLCKFVVGFSVKAITVMFSFSVESYLCCEAEEFIMQSYPELYKLTSLWHFPFLWCQNCPCLQIFYSICPLCKHISHFTTSCFNIPIFSGFSHFWSHYKFAEGQCAMLSLFWVLGREFVKFLWH